MKRLVCVLLLASFLIIVIPVADSAVITQTKNFSGIPSINGSLAFNKFDTHGSAWTLNSIQVSLTLQSSGGWLRLDNDGANPASGNFEFGAEGTINSTNVSLLSSSFTAIPGQVNACHSQAFSLAANIGDGSDDYDPTPPDGMLYTGGIETDNKSGFVGSAFWAAYQGTGTYNINYEVLPRFNFGSIIGGLEWAINPVNVSGYVQVIYNYTIIPEPATMILLSLGGLLLRKYKH